MANQTIRILLVDGSSVTRALLTKTLLQELPHVEVTACESGKEALQKLSGARFDLLSTALVLPDMDGLALCRKIRQSNELSYVPVIIVSGDADTRLLHEGFAAGITDYFDKSKGYKAFGSFVKGFIQRHSGMVGHILFVEDSATAAAVTGKILDQYGLTVLRVNTAEEAMSYVADSGGNHSQIPIDLVITDFYLEGKMTGGDLLYAIRVTLHMSQQELPVLVLTGNNDDKTHIEVFHAGANDYVNKPIIEEILIARVRTLLLIKHQHGAIKEQAETMRWIAATDSLTGVRNKHYLINNGPDYLHDSHQQPVWALLLDIDHFRQLNTSKGHIMGDHVLAAVGDLLNNHFPDAMVVRFGGEEFSILLPNTHTEQAMQQAEKLRQDIADLHPVGINITISIGMVSSLDFPNLHLSQFLANADKALNAAKERGRNRICIYTDDDIVDAPRQESIIQT